MFPQKSNRNLLLWKFMNNLEKINKINKTYIKKDNLDEKQIINKAVRHYLDAIYLRNLREDFDNIKNPKLYFIFWNSFNIYSNPYWKIFLFYLTIAFILLNFFGDTFNEVKFNDYNRNLVVIIFEIFILSIYFIDAVLGIIQFISLFNYYKRKNSTLRILKLNKYSYYSHYIKIITIFLLIIEFFLYHYYEYYFRIALIMKIILLPIYDRDLEEFLISLLLTYKQIIEFLTYIMIFNVIYTALGVKMFQTLDDLKIKKEQNNLKNWEDYRNFFDLFIGLQILMTFDNWPTIIPNIKNFTYFLYFLPYIVFVLLCFIPVPVAMLYESFKVNRKKFEERKKIYIKSCLNCCYDTLVEDNLLTKKRFLELFEGIYKGKNNFNRQKVINLYLEINGVINKSLTRKKFLKIRNKLIFSLKLKKINHDKYNFFIKIKKFLNQKFGLRLIINSFFFEFFLIIVVLVNSVSNILLYIDSLKKYEDIINIIDKYCTYFYLFEFTIKFWSLGFFKYFIDPWNKFDFIILLISILNIYFIEYFTALQGFSGAKLIRLSRLQKIIKITKSFKNLKFFTILNFILAFLNRIKNMFYYLIVCLPSILNSLNLLLMIYYIYAIIGIIIFNKDNIILNQTKDYNNDFFGNFTSLLQAFFLLFQVMLGKNWSKIMFYHIEKYGNIFFTLIYFFSFYFLVRTIILSLLLGLVWETFGIQDKGMKNFLSRTLFKNLKYHKNLFKKHGIEITNSKYLYENLNNFQEAYLKYLTLNEICIINSDIESIENNDSFETDDEINSIKLPKDYKVKLYFEIEEEFKNNNYDSNYNSISSLEKEFEDKNNIRFKNILNDQNLKFESGKTSNINILYLNDTQKIIKLKTSNLKNNFSNYSDFNLDTNTDNSYSDYSKESINEFAIYKNEIMSIIIFLRKRISTFNKAMEKYKHNINHKILNKIFPSLVLENNYNRYLNYKNILKNNLNKNKFKNKLPENTETREKISELLNNYKKISYIKQLGIEKKNNGIIRRTEVKFNEPGILDFSNSYIENKKEKFFCKKIGPIFNKYITKYNPITINNFNLQSQILNLFNYIFTSNDINPNFFINALIYLENILNFKMLKFKSIAKFIVINSNSNNYMFYNIKKYLDFNVIKNYDYKLYKLKNNFIIDIISNCFIENEINYGFDILNNDLIKSFFHEILYNLVLNSNKEMFNFDLKENIWSIMGFKWNCNEENIKKFKFCNKNFNEIKNINLFIFESVYDIKKDKNIKENIKNKKEKKKNNTFNDKNNLKSLYELNLFWNDIIKLFKIYENKIFILLHQYFSKNKIK